MPLILDLYLYTVAALVLGMMAAIVQGAVESLLRRPPPQPRKDRTT